jgi:hypothetical protein
MRLCFVIQPFDRGPFDARFRSTLAPAIQDAGLEPYRVDHDPSTVIPSDDIQAGIRGADACVADITLDNPNVWLEVGLAISANKPILLLANGSAREAFPFDVRHRHIVKYATQDITDFVRLRHEITSRLRVLVFGADTGVGPLAPSAIDPRASLDAAVREEMGKAAALKRALDDVNAQKDAFFQRLLRVCEILGHRAYENINEPDYAESVHQHAETEAANIVKQYGLDEEWRAWRSRKL